MRTATLFSLQAIKPSQQFTWCIVDKRNPDNRKSLISLKVVYTMENLPFDNVEEYEALLEMLLRYELNESGVSQYWWDGKFTKVGESLLTYYKAGKDLPHARIKLAQWKVYCKVQADYPLAYALFDAVLEQMEPFILHQSTYDRVQMTDFWSATTKMLEYTMQSLEKFQFDNEKRALNMMKVLNRILRIMSMCRLGLCATDMLNAIAVNGALGKRDRSSIEELVVDALKENVKTWFLEQTKDMKSSAIAVNPEVQRVQRVFEVVEAITDRLNLLILKYQPIFKK